jgi:hypothetical protein
MIQLHSIESILSENGGGLCGFNIDIGVYDYSSERSYLPFCVNHHQPLLLSNSHFPSYSDGTHEYLYAHTRLAQLNTGTLDTEYYLTDALGSVRQRLTVQNITRKQGESFRLSLFFCSE